MSWITITVDEMHIDPALAEATADHGFDPPPGSSPTTDEDPPKGGSSVSGRFNSTLTEARIPKGELGGGQWTSGVSPIYGKGISPVKNPIIGTDPTRMANLPPELQQQLVDQLAKVFPGMTPAQLEANLNTTLEAGLLDDQSKAGLTWYPEAKGIAEKIADDGSYTDSEAVGAIAAMSPQQEWGGNVATTSFTASTIHADEVVNLTAHEATKVRGELGITKTGTFDAGRVLSDYPPREAAAIIKALGQRGDGLHFVNGRGNDARATWSCGLNGVEGAVKILRGESINDTLNGHKVRSFFNNILNGSDSGGAVTIDTHAISAALGFKLTAKDKRMSAILAAPRVSAYSMKGAYALFADAYRNVAAKHHLSPEQAQAVIWLQWRRNNP